MSINKKSNDATEKKGMALSDDALANVTGGKTYYAVEYYDYQYGGGIYYPKYRVLDREPTRKDGGFNGINRAFRFEYDGDIQGAENYFKENMNSPAVSEHHVCQFLGF